MLSPGTGASVNISVSHSLQQLLHKKVVCFDWGSAAEWVCWMRRRVRSFYSQAVRHSSTADRQAPEQPVQNILILAQFFPDIVAV